MTPEEETKKFALNVFVVWIPVMIGAILILSIIAFVIVRYHAWRHFDRPFWPECFCKYHSSFGAYSTVSMVS